MKKIIGVILLSLLLTGCYKEEPTNQQAIDIAKKELAGALCGDKDTICLIAEGGAAKVGERRNDNSHQITVTFKKIRATNDDVGRSHPINVDSGMVVYDFDAKTGGTKLKELTLWSEDGKHSVELCSSDGKFCRK